MIYYTQAPEGVSRAWRLSHGGSTSFLISYTNPHGGTNACTQPPNHLFNNVLHPTTEPAAKISAAAHP